MYAGIYTLRSYQIPSRNYNRHYIKHRPNTTWRYKGWYVGFDKKKYEICLPFVSSFCADESDPHPLVSLRINKQNNTIK